MRAGVRSASLEEGERARQSGARVSGDRVEEEDKVINLVALFGDFPVDFPLDVSVVGSWADAG